MDIFEDKDPLENEPEKTGVLREKKSEEKKPSPGTRIIYQAPESGAKREYVGFSAADYSSERKKKTPEYKGGFDFEKEMLGEKAADEKEKNVRPDEKALRQQKLREQRIKKLLGDSELEDVDIEDENDDELDVEEIYIGAKKRPISTGEKIRRTVLIISCLAIVISLAVLGYQFWQYKRNEKMTSSFSDLIITDPVANEGNDKSEEKTTEKILTVEEQWEKLRQENPDLEFPAGIQLRYAKLYAANRDFVGFLTIDSLGIGLPVVQGNDNSYYMRRNFYKESSKYGCLFVPKDSDMKGLSRNTVIYGHNMSDGSMFAALKAYKTVDGFRNSPVIQFDTIYGTYKWKVIAAFITNADKKQDNGYVFPYNFTTLNDSDEFMKYISVLKQRSLYDTGVDVVSTDKLLTLSTCTYDFDNARFVVVARMVRSGESENVDTSKAAVNGKPRYPQAYYDKKKKKNPYKGAENWYYYAE